MLQIRRMLCIFLVVTSLAACQPTPDNHPDSIELVDFSAISSASIQRSEKLSDGISLMVNAAVETPECPLPYGEYINEPFTKEDIAAVYHALCGDAQPLRYAETIENLYDYVAYGREMLIMLEDKISEEEKAYEEQLLNDILANTDRAPQKKEPADLSEILSYPDKIIQVDLGKNWDASFQVWTEPHDMLYFRNFGFPVIDTTELAITEEQAIAVADKVLSELKIKDHFSVANINEEAILHSVFEELYLDKANCSKGYRILYLRRLNDCEQLFHANLTRGIPREYHYDFQQEYIEFLIDETGILSFQWQSPGSIVIAGNQSEVVSVANATEIAIQRLRHSYNGFTFKDVETSKIKIVVERISLGCSCIPAENNRIEILPVWEFYGRIEDHSEKDVRYYDPYTGTWREACAQNESLMTINAINGQIIDRTHPS